MEKYYKCSKIHVTSNKFPDFIPKTGECSLQIYENYGIITLKTLKTKVYFGSASEEEIITHEVLF